MIEGEKKDFEGIRREREEEGRGERERENNI